MISPLHSRKGGSKPLSPEDITRMRHDFMMCYGWITDEEWDKLSIDAGLDLWELVNKEIKKKEEFRLYSLKFYGVKNPE